MSNILNKIYSIFILLLSIFGSSLAFNSTLNGNAQELGSLITSANINSQNSFCTNAGMVIGNTTTCVFPLMGDESNIYIHPETPITAQISSVTPYSWGCSITDNYTLNARLTCTNVQSENGIEGVQTVKTNLEGDDTAILVTLYETQESILPSEIKGYNIDSGSSSCTEYQLNVGQSMTCTFKLFGAYNNHFLYPSTPITASISTSSAYSWGCDLLENQTENVNLTCTNVPSDNATNGIRTIKTNLFADYTAIQVVINSDVQEQLPTVIGFENIDSENSYCQDTVLLIGSTTTCNFKLMGANDNTYINPISPITASISSGTAYSWGCSIMDNYTQSAYLKCTNVPSENGSEGLQTVKTNLEGDNLQIPINLVSEMPNTER
jgi:hypothetical protein